MDNDLLNFLDSYIESLGFVDCLEDKRPVEDLQKIALNAMVIFIIRKQFSVQQREELIVEILKFIKNKFLKDLNEMSKDRKIEDLMAPHREDVIVQMNKNIQEAEDRLREVLL
jgi:hypothetical protein